MNRFIRKLKKVRKDRGCTVEQIAAQTRISAEKLNGFENGKIFLTVEELEKLLDYYQLSYEQVIEYKSHRKSRILLLIMGLGVLIAGVACYILFYGSLLGTLLNGEPGPADVNNAARSDENKVVHSDVNKAALADETNAGPEKAGPAAETGSAAEDRTGPATEDNAGIATEVKAAPANEDTAANEEAAASKVTFRFWGNVPYDAASVPKVDDSDSRNVIDVFPIERLSKVRPSWVQDHDPDKLILNAGTADVWTDSTVEAFQQLKKEGYRVLGLGKIPDVHSPLIIQVNSKKVGFLSLAGIIHRADEIALKTKIGLPRAYTENDVVPVVKAAKAKADYLFVLIDWGKTWSQTHSASQKKMAEMIVRAGADCIIGNHPLYAQEIALVQGKPVFYGLGHSVSKHEKEASYNYVLEFDFAQQPEEARLRVGKLHRGKIGFQLTAEDKNQIRNKLSVPKELENKVKLLY